MFLFDEGCSGGILFSSPQILINFRLFNSFFCVAFNITLEEKRGENEEEEEERKTLIRRFPFRYVFFLFKKSVDRESK